MTLTIKQRQELKTLFSEWKTFPFEHKILAAELANGWAGRNPKKNAIATLTLYVQKALTPPQHKTLRKWLEAKGIPSVYIETQQWYCHYMNQNRLPSKDTQNRFWVFNSIQALDGECYDHWLYSPKTWGIYFTPSVSETQRIFESDDLFERMLPGEYNAALHLGQGIWVDCIKTALANDPIYTLWLETEPISAQDLELDEFIAQHKKRRADAMAAKQKSSFILPYNI